MTEIDAPKLIVVSGISRGLGLEIAEQLLEAGYRVAGFSRTKSAGVEKLQEAYGGGFLHRIADACDGPAVTQFVEEAAAQLGTPFGVINNSAVVVDGVLATLPEVEISRMVQTDLVAPMLLTRLCIRRMLHGKGGGRVINISSITGSRGYSGLAAYSACKAGLDGLTRSLARELGPRNITVNSIAPGYMRTELSGSLEASRLGQIVRRTPLGRLAEPRDIVPAVRFFLSAGAALITGQTLIIDGGLSC